MTTAPNPPMSACSRTCRDSILVLATVLLGATLLSGCLSRPSLAKQSFTLSSRPRTSNAATAANRVLGIKRLTITGQFDDQSLAYRTGEFSYERDPYAEFLVPPAEAFAVSIRGYFRDSGLFSSVTEPGSAMRPDIVVEIFIDQFYGDFRNRGDSCAVLGMRFIFFNAPAGIPGTVLARKDCSRQIRVKARTAASLVEGWNEGLTQILDEVCSDLRTNGLASHDSFEGVQSSYDRQSKLRTELDESFP